MCEYLVCLAAHLCVCVCVRVCACVFGIGGLRVGGLMYDLLLECCVMECEYLGFSEYGQ